MGSAASLNEYNVDAQIQNRYRQEIAALFVEEFYRLKNTKATKDELCSEFIDVLQEKEPSILTKIGLSNQKKSSQSSNMINDGRAGGGVGTDVLDEETEFRQLCVDTVDKIRLKNTLVYMACIDGSNGANIAFRTMMRLKKRLDHINLFHAFSKAKNQSLPSDYHSDVIKQHYESELISTYRVPVNRFHFDWIDRKNKTVIDILQNILDGYQYHNSRADAPPNSITGTGPQPNFLFIGYHGRKGDGLTDGDSNRSREDEKSGGNDNKIMGTFTEYCLYHAYMPVIICKSLCPTTQRLFILAVDGSPLSKRGFDICLALINPKDSLRIVNVYNPRKTGTGCEPPPYEIEEFYNHEIESFGPYDSSFTTLTCPIGRSIADCLVEFSDNVGGDFLILSPRTRRYMSATVEHVIAQAKASIILVKN